MASKRKPEHHGPRSSMITGAKEHHTGGEFWHNTGALGRCLLNAPPTNGMEKRRLTKREQNVADQPQSGNEPTTIPTAPMVQL
jgi:hypothetical protein